MLKGIRASEGRVDEEEGSDKPGSWRCRINDGKNNRSDQYTADITNVSWDGFINERQRQRGEMNYRESYHKGSPLGCAKGWRRCHNPSRKC